MFVLLAGASIFSVVIWRVRAEFSGTGRDAFLIWNLFLAWIPYAITSSMSSKGWKFAAAFIVWLLFIPNSFWFQ